MLFRIKLLIFFASVFMLAACSSEPVQKQIPLAAPDTGIKQPVMDSSSLALKIQPDGLELFIDSMEKSGFRIDTNHLKQVSAWYAPAGSPKTVFNKQVVVLMEYPDELFKEHFSEPRTYFFAYWNEEKKTFKNGNDFLLMTWDIDSAGIKKEEKLYHSLQGFMGNLPCFVFRHEKRVYAMAHRQTVAADYTFELTRKLRDYIAPSAKIYRPFGGEE